MELGLYTFADVNPEAAAGERGRDAAERARHLLEEIELADQVGLDVFGLGEHHRPDYMASAPAMLLAAAAALTESPTPIKHIIVLADGSDSEEKEGVPELLDGLTAEDVTISFVSIGGGPDVPWLQEMAARGNGWMASSRRMMCRSTPSRS